ncbi:prothymosin alpha-B isoform X3 [Eucyclogobius newberryi]|uniref:prothymosin alpha-B isoform X3 n=1 Tax=Eucyclogobius newberryi TaxID=166745 RepID=UPI003B5CDDE3
MADTKVDSGSDISAKDLKEKKLVEDKENGKDAATNGKENEENGEPDVDDEEEEEVDEEDEEDDGEGGGGDEESAGCETGGFHDGSQKLTSL